MPDLILGLHTGTNAAAAIGDSSGILYCVQEERLNRVLRRSVSWKSARTSLLDGIHANVLLENGADHADSEGARSSLGARDIHAGAGGHVRGQWARARVPWHERDRAGGSPDPQARLALQAILLCLRAPGRVQALVHGSGALVCL